jgi:hypothetical protein
MLRRPSIWHDAFFRAAVNRMVLGALGSEQTQGADMSNTKQDRARVAGGQDHEVQYEAGKTGASKAEVKEAVKSAGNSRSAVEQKLGSK